MGFIDSLRSLAGSGDSGDHRETDELIETAVAQAVPKIRTVNGYKRKLQDDVNACMAFARQMVDSLGEPVPIKPRLASRDPLVSAFFTSSEEAIRVLSGVPAMAECFFLLIMTRKERTVQGIALQGEMIQKGVIQQSVTFTDHEILAASPSLQHTKRELTHLIVQDLSWKAAEDIAKTHKGRAEMSTLRDNLKAELHTLELDSANLPRTSDRRAEADRAMASIREELDRVELELHDLTPRLDSLDDYLAHVRQILANPQGSLSLEQVSLHLNEFGIKVDAFSNEQGFTVNFIEVRGRQGTRAVLLGQMRREGPDSGE